MTADNSFAIRVENLSFSDDGMDILKNITGTFTKGKITSIVGPSGAGKTTLFRMINGLKSPTSGEIYIDGKVINDYPPVELRRKVGFAIQDAPMIPGTVKKNLELPLVLKGENLPDHVAKEYLQLVGLEESFLDRNSEELSGGQRQKLSIARTLVNKPDILLLDEITSSLDRISQRDVEELIQRVNKELGTTILWITHNLSQAIHIAEETWVLMNGEVIETGSSDLLNNPADTRVKEFVKGEESS